MKPRNFPGRRHARKERANARANHAPAPATSPTVADIRWRIGAHNRDPITGVGREVVA